MARQDEKRMRIGGGFHRSILETMAQALGNYPQLQGAIERALA
jgi:hypothetical protein